MKKLITLCLALAGFVGTVSAATLYVSVDNFNWWNGHVRVSAWGDTNQETDYLESQAVVIYGRKWYAFDMGSNTNAQVRYWYTENNVTMQGNAFSKVIAVSGDMYVVVNTSQDESDNNNYYYASYSYPTCRNNVANNWNSTDANMTYVDNNTLSYEFKKSDIMSASGLDGKIWFSIFNWGNEIYRYGDDDMISIAGSTTSYYNDENTYKKSFGIVLPDYDYSSIVVTATFSTSTSTWTVSADAYVSVNTNSNGFATFVSGAPLTISSATAYYATDNNNGSATAYAITNPAASTPMLIKGDARTTYYFAVAASGTDYSSTNAFKTGSGSAVASYDDETNPTEFRYILNGGDFYLANDQLVASNKAYLQLSKQAGAGARVLKFLDNEETGINAITARADDADACYNLSGQRVSKPAKGLFIQGGKKIIVK